MKKLLLSLLLTISIQSVIAQNAYIQVNGEPGLSVYLNNQYKGKTSAEYNGYIIENVTAGQNIIKIVKEGFTPYEETITVKKGEVFSFKVRPFTKHVVNISEQGNVGETDKKAVISTGKLIVQSVPIEIKIAIPDIEGVNGVSKSKDQWIADKIPAGNYKIIFTFNQKTITKTVEINDDNTTSVFVNMLNGEFTTNSTVAEKKEKARQAAYYLSIFDKFKFKPGMMLDEFMAYNPEAKVLLSYQWGTTGDFFIPQKDQNKNKELTPGPESLSRRYLGNKRYGVVSSYIYTLILTKDYNVAKKEFDKWLNELKSNINNEYIDAESDNIMISYFPDVKGRLSISLKNHENNWYELSIHLMD